MSSNYQTILNAVLEDLRKKNLPDLSSSKFFQLFSVDQILKNYGLDTEEIASGITDEKGHDGGVDAMYTFVNGLLVTEGLKADKLRGNMRIELIIIQSKLSPGFSEDTLHSWRQTVEDLLCLNIDTTSKLRVAYNATLLRLFDLWRTTYQGLMHRAPELRVTFYFATSGDRPHPNVERLAEVLKQSVKKIHTASICEINFVGAEELLKLHSKSRVQIVPLRTAEYFQDPTGGCVCLVNLKDFYRFISDEEEGQLRAWLFEENVRDYEGRSIEVNKGIRYTLENRERSEEFWWLNNGITMVASAAPISSQIINITEPRIVNGLQTSTEIYNHFHDYPDENDERRLLVRVIVTSDEQTMNSIIKSTNKQSAISDASLRAFDAFQERLQEFFEANDLYYERRKNYYKNQGYPASKIISITYLAQAIAAIVLQRPNDSRGRPSTLIKDNTLYAKLFDPKMPVEVYVACVRFMRQVEDFLKSEQAPKYVSGNEINIKFQLAMFASAMKAKHQRATPLFIQKGGLGKIDDEFLKDCLGQVWTVFKAQMKSNKLDPDRVGKSLEFDEAVKNHLILLCQIMFERNCSIKP